MTDNAILLEFGTKVNGGLP